MNESDILPLLDGLEDARLDFVVARVRHKSDNAALREAGISHASFYSWSDKERLYLSKVVQDIKRLFVAKQIMDNPIFAHYEEESVNCNPEDPSSNTGFVYFIRQENKIKIGYSKNVNARLRQLQTSSPIKLELIGYVYGDLESEKQLHELFDDYRLSGEWFEYADEIKEHISGLDLITGEEQACQSETQAENFNRA